VYITFCDPYNFEIINVNNTFYIINTIFTIMISIFSLSLMNIYLCHSCIDSQRTKYKISGNLIIHYHLSHLLTIF